MTRAHFRGIGGGAATVVLVVLSVALSANPSLGVIYGEDDRVNPHDYPADEWQRIARESSAALMSASDVQCSEGSCELAPTPTLGEYFDLCSEESYWSQPTGAFCSGFLVGDDLIATAGHCISNQSECDDTVFVFNYMMIDDDTPTTTLPESDIYHCTQIVARQEAGSIDYAILQLDRPVEPGLRPLPLRRAGDVALDADVAALLMVGHPGGLPTKLTLGPSPVGASGLSGAGVMDAHPGWFASNLDAFVDNLDSFGGNSGSAVISLNERGDLHLVEGVLVRGADDWAWDAGGSCYHSNVCDDTTGCAGVWEEVTRATEFAALVPYACGDGRCDPPEDEVTCPADCLGDLDGDGVEESQDNCPGVHNTLQGDSDGDHAGDPCDCEPALAEIWATPGEVRHLRCALDEFTGEIVLEWFPPREEGSTVLVYDVLRSDAPIDFLGPAVCLESDEGADRVARDAESPPPGAALYYLVRAQNNCLDGEGPLGWRWDGAPRLGVACPPVSPGSHR